MIHWHCGWPRDCCPCPQDELTMRSRWIQVQRRHRAAVALARANDRRAQRRAERERRRAS